MNSHIMAIAAYVCTTCFLQESHRTPCLLVPRGIGVVARSDGGRDKPIAAEPVWIWPFAIPHPLLSFRRRRNLVPRPQACFEVQSFLLGRHALRAGRLRRACPEQTCGNPRLPSQYSKFEMPDAAHFQPAEPSQDFTSAATRVVRLVHVRNPYPTQLTRHRQMATPTDTMGCVRGSP
jgi:hypothetical protein